MNLPCLFVPNELSDEAVACVAELLLNFAHAFDSQYATQHLSPLRRAQATPQHQMLVR